MEQFRIVSKTIYSIIWGLLFLMGGCFNLNESFNTNSQKIEKNDGSDYHVELLSGDRQRYIGMSPDPLKFRIYDDKNEQIIKDIYFNDSDLWIEVSSVQGLFTLIESPAGNCALRKTQVSCDCFKLHWHLIPEDAPEIGGSQVDSVVVRINVIMRSTGDPIEHSPLEVIHYPAD